MKLEDWLKGATLAKDEFDKKYRFQDESFDEFLDRVANKDKQVKENIIERKFIYGGRILANRGLSDYGEKVTYSNCYVISPPEDNIESIYETAGKLARTFSMGGGCGIDISKLRPKGAKVNNSAKTTTGAVSFMDTFSLVAETIGQKGRRGALMLSIDCTHPDLLEFIDIKSDLDRVTKANISVRMNSEFMEAAKNNKDFTLRYDMPNGIVYTETINAKEVLQKLAHNNWDYAEPGILYWDKIKNYNLLQHFDEFEYAGVNPCAEEPLPAGGSCLLGSINLSAFVKNPFTDKAEFDYKELAYVVKESVEALNDVLLEGLPLHPLKEQQDTVGDYRQIGLGIMGLADCLIKMRITYGSELSLKFVDNIMSTILAYALIESSEYMEKHKLLSFAGYDAHKVLESDIVKNLLDTLHKNGQENLMIQVTDAIGAGLFNSQLLTIAPTGTTAGLMNTSYGAEPNFAYSYTRKTESLHDKDTYYVIEAPIVKEYREVAGDKSEQLPEYFITTHQLDPFKRIDMQAELQKFVDASISSTINLPEDTTAKEIYDIYMYGHEKGVKGLTVYRNNCQRSGVLTLDKKEEVEEKVDKTGLKLQFGDTIMIDNNNIGIKRKLRTGCGSLHCTFYFCPETGELREVFLDKGSEGGCSSLLNAVSRLTSLLARKGAPVEEIVDQLKSVHVCPNYRVQTALHHNTSPGSSCASAVAKALVDAHDSFMEDFINEESEEVIQKVEVPKKSKKPSVEDMYEICPQCGEKSAMKTEGCISCHNCGYSKCN